MQMSVLSVVSRYGPPALLGAVSTAALTFAINFLTDGRPGWWWIVLVLGALGFAGAGVWGYLVQHNPGGDGPASRSESVSVAQQDAGVAQQSATGNGTNVAINADNQSAAAWEIGTVNLGGGPDNPKPKTQ
jgi:hypothetical protein